MYKAVGHCRVSKGDTNEIKNSLASQKSEILKLSKRFELKEEIQQVKEDLRKEFQEANTKLQQEFQEANTKLRQDFEQSITKLTIDFDIKLEQTKKELQKSIKEGLSKNLEKTSDYLQDDVFPYLHPDHEKRITNLENFAKTKGYNMVCETKDEYNVD